MLSLEQQMYIFYLFASPLKNLTRSSVNSRCFIIHDFLVEGLMDGPKPNWAYSYWMDSESAVITDEVSSVLSLEVLNLINV